MISEVDVADPENAKATAAYHGEAIELQMGNEYFRHRFGVFLNQFPGLEAEIRNCEDGRSAFQRPGGAGA